AILSHRISLEEIVRRVFDEGDKACSRRVPTLAEEEKAPRSGQPTWIGHLWHLSQRHDELCVTSVHVHLPDTCLVGSYLVFVPVLDPHIIRPSVFHAHKNVSQSLFAIG